MYQIQLDKAPVFSSIDAILNDPALLRIQTHQAESFGDHLQRAQTWPEAPAAAERSGAPAAATARETTAQPRSTTEGQRHEGREDDTAQTQQNGAQKASAERPVEENSPQNDPPQGESEDAPPNLNAETTEDSEADPRSQQDEERADEADSAEATAKIAAEIPVETTLQTTVEDKASQGGSGQQEAASTGGSEDPGANQKTSSGQSQTASEQPAVAEARLADGDLAVESAAEDGQTIVQQQGRQDDGAKDPTNEPIETEIETAATADDDSAPQQGENAAAAGQAQALGSQVSTSNRPRRSQGRSERKPTVPDRVEGPAAATPQHASTSTETTTALSASPQTPTVEANLAAGELKAETTEGAAKPVSSGNSDSQSNFSTRGESTQGSKTGSTQPSQKADGPGQVDRTRFVQRVARAFQTMGDRSGTVRLRLSPPELGSLRLEISVRNGMMTANVEAETPAARNLLLDNLPALRERLAQQDIKVEQFNVDLSGRSPGGSPDQMADHANPRQPDGGRTPHPDVEPEEEPDPSEPGSPPGEVTQLNIVI